jgi:hypothetical protein
VMEIAQIPISLLRIQNGNVIGRLLRNVKVAMLPLEGSISHISCCNCAMARFCSLRLRHGARDPKAFSTGPITRPYQRLTRSVLENRDRNARITEYPELDLSRMAKAAETHEVSVASQVP